MNKQLIKTYFEEFRRWLNGGKLLQKQLNLAIPAEWEEFVEDWDWPIDELAVIINDEYVEFRRALAEGKEVEYSITDLNGKHIRWVNILDQINSYNINTKVFNYEPSAYRIKPAKFKVGDWFIHSSGIHQVKEVFGDSYRAEDGFDYMEDITPWQPTESKWCWYKHMLVKVININHRENGVTSYSVSSPMLGESYSGAITLEPFIGQLPTILQDN